jgi:HK97 family phage major capsid protein
VTLKEQREAAYEKAAELAEKVKAGETELASELETAVAEVKSLDEQIAEARKGRELVDQLGRMKSVHEAPLDQGSTGAKSLGEHVVKSIGERMRGSRGSKFDLVAPEFKAATDVQVTPGSLAPALTDIDTNIVSGARRQLVVADLLGTESISGTALTYFVEGALEGDFTGVLEGAQKPQIHFGDPTPVTESLTKIAAFYKESDEIVNDLPWLVSSINNRALYQLGLYEENQLLSGSGTGTNLRGLLNRSGIQTLTIAAGASKFDGLLQAISNVQLNSGLPADGIVISPADYFALQTSKDVNGQYLLSGPGYGAYGNGAPGGVSSVSLWGIPTVVTAAIAQGTVLVGAFSQAASLIRKGGVTVETTNSDGDDFTNNRITIRVEERLALAVRRPAGFVKVTLEAE